MNEDIRGLDDIRDTSFFSHRFFEGLEEFEDRDFDNYVLDVGVVYSVAAGREYLSDIFPGGEGAENVSRLFDQEVQEVEKGNREVIQFRSTPSSRVLTAEALSEESDLYMPDITEDCLRLSNEEMPYRDEVLEAFEQETSALSVMDYMGIESYTREGLEETGMRDEDEAIVQASKELEGDTCVLTYDEDFLSKDGYTAVPEVAEKVR